MSFVRPQFKGNHEDSLNAHAPHGGRRPAARYVEAPVPSSRGGRQRVYW